ncbi:MFS transporter [Galactobacter valiniphilus]|uniref:MFS transporter n=2 Tax=Galactobacter valiniphilus TaxID=2676122 RepID=A0A399JBV9_9MICC|nr:MFS transporter [Galactobacter valiniphilus]
MSASGEARPGTVRLITQWQMQGEQMNDGARLRSLPAFRGLWLANAGSDAARLIAVFAIQVSMTLTLHASTFEVGLVSPLSNAGALALGLVAGVYVDRWGAKRTMLASVWLRVLAYGAPVLLWCADLLAPWQLLVCVVLASVADTFFSTGHQAVLPALVGRSRVPDAAASLMATDQVITLAGPAAGGLLTRLMPAPLVLGISTLTQFLAIGGLTRLPADPPAAQRPRERVWPSMREGWAYLRGTPLLAAIMAAATLNNFAAGFYQSAETVFILRELGMDPVVFGLVWSLSAVGGIGGAILAPRAGRRFGALRVMFAACCVMPLNFALIPAASWVPHAAQPLMIFASFFLFGACIGFMAVSSSGVAAALTPNELLARVSSVRRTLTQGATVVGGLLGAALGALAGVGWTLWFAATLAVLQVLPLIRVGVPRKAAPDEAELALGGE